MTATTPTTASNSIEEQVLLPTSRERVWRALTNAEEFGAWFGANLKGATIAPGAHVVGQITIPNYEHVTFDIIVEEMVPERRFAWRWHPHAVEKGVDYSAEPRTLVTFTLEDAAGGGTLVRVVESGFRGLPEWRRDSAFRGNSGGWRGQLTGNLPAYLTRS